MSLPLDDWPRDEDHRCVNCGRFIADHTEDHLDLCVALAQAAATGGPGAVYLELEPGYRQRWRWRFKRLDDS